MNETTMDMEMTEVVETAEQPTNAVAQTPQNDVAGNFLSLARQLVDQGLPSQALQAVVMAMKTKGGEEAVYYILQRARELYRSKLQASDAADQLASLFAECVIAEAQPAASQLSQPPQQSLLPTQIDSDARGKSILVESGRKQIVLDAFADGSSFICLQCGGLVSNHRKDEHYAYWCEF
ncbi:hypothetical protein KSS87_017074 [Heliosperma pusillum]|nr:hypothetical protein KSS87_001669 [Heliosperma pusillum]KAH9625599.1 hypothetical protein KSS87_017074 [Heliosperma pusillum]